MLCCDPQSGNGCWSCGVHSGAGLHIEQQLEGITIEVQADEIELLIDRALPLGLIVNEAIVNSVKHAFGDDEGMITVGL